MRCFFCKKEAIGICKYCGRAICNNHKVTGPISLVNSLDLKEDLVERDFDPYLLWCGKCVSDELIEQVQLGNFEFQSPPEIIEEFCSHCNGLIQSDDIFCNQCGNKS